MQGQKIKDARSGCVEFLRNCALNQVSCAIHPMNKEALDLDTNLPELAALAEHIKGTGSTPMYETLNKAQESEPKATRYIVFSDGQADWSSLRETCISIAIEEKTPVDTVYITEYVDSEYKDCAYTELKDLADKTGGIFLVFDRNKVNFSTAFKYLTPGYRHLLASESFRQNLQEGKV